MIRHINEVEQVAARYGLRLALLDATDITLMARLEIEPEIFIQLYRSTGKNKLNMALVVAGSRLYGIDNEGGIPHAHPAENPDAHIPVEHQPSVDEFVIKCLQLIEAWEGSS